MREKECVINNGFSRYLNIPEQLRRMPNWVCFKCIPIPGSKKIKKEPLGPHGESVGSNGMKVWLPESKKFKVVPRWYRFDECVEAINFCVGNAIGFALNGASVACIDLDDCFTEDGINSTAKTWIDKMSPCHPYIERSYSGNGLHIFVWYSGKGIHKPNIMGAEVYTEGQFIVMTGDVYNG